MNSIKIKGVEYQIVTPVKSLFRSTMVHDVITKGRKFAINPLDGTLTIIDPKDADEALVITLEVFSEETKDNYDKLVAKQTLRREQERELVMFMRSTLAGHYFVLKRNGRIMYVGNVREEVVKAFNRC